MAAQPFMQGAQMGQQPPPKGMSETYLWAQNQYMVDSGVQSGSTTGAPSMMSGASSLHDDLIYGSGAFTPGDPTVFTAADVDEINEQYNATRSQRIRAAMFPEQIDDGGVPNMPPGVQYTDLGQGSNVQRLTEPSQMLKTAVVNLINYQDDAEVTMKAIPELIKLLGDEDQVVASHAAMMVHQLSKSEASLRAMVGHPDLVHAVVKAMTDARDPTTIKYTAGTLYHISSHGQGLFAIFQSGGIKALVALLGHPTDCVVFYAITTLHNLLLHLQGAKETVREVGGVEKMVNLLDRNDVPKFLAITTDCLQILCYGDSPSKLRILHANGPAKLVTILRQQNYEKLLWTTSRVLKALSVCPETKVALVHAGAMQALTVGLDHASGRLLLNCLFTLRNLSDAATKEENLGPLIVKLIQLLGCAGQEQVTCCAGTLSNLTCNNQRNKATVCRNNGIDNLLRCLQHHGENPEIAEPALCTLRHVTSRHPDAAEAANAIRLLGGIRLICEKYLRSHNPQLAKAALGLVRNLAGNEANLGQLRELDSVESAVAALQSTFEDVRKAHMQQQQPPVIDGVGVMEIMEVAAGALQALFKDPHCRARVRQNHHLVNILVAMLSFDVDHIQRFASGAILELTKDPEGAKMVEQAGAIPSLNELIHSKSEAIKAYSSSALYNMGRDKPADYQRNLEMEVNSALYRDDSAPWTQDGLAEMQGISEEPFADMMYQQAAYDPSSMDTSAGGGWDQQQGAAPTPPQLYQQQQGGGPPSGPPQGGSMPPPRQQGAAGHVNQGWYDTDC